MSTSLLELIADPVRLSVVRTLADRRSAGLAEIAERAGVHPNTARARLAELERKGMVVRARPAGGARGRPAVRYALAEGWSMPPAESAGLAALMAALVHRLDPDRTEVDELGRQWGRYVAGRPGARTDLSSLVQVVERLGFDGELDGSTLRLRACPCPLVSPQDSGLVCRLVTAVVDGVARASDERRRVSSARHDPVRRSCALELGVG
jgi:predicted ArsR family transcriptional regulator